MPGPSKYLPARTPLTDPDRLITREWLLQLQSLIDTLLVSGDVFGPASSVNNDIVLFSGTTGKHIKDSGVPISALSKTKQTEIDFGALPVAEGSFVVVDADVTVTSHIVGEIAYDAPTGKDLDEITMDPMVIACGQAAAGSFTIYALPLLGYVADKFKVSYVVG